MANSKLNFELKTITVQSVRKIMDKMRMNKSAGPDEISQECLLLGKSVLAGPLTWSQDTAKPWNSNHP